MQSRGCSHRDGVHWHVYQFLVTPLRVFFVLASLSNSLVSLSSSGLAIPKSSAISKLLIAFVNSFSSKYDLPVQNEVIKIIACAISKLLIAFENSFNSKFDLPVQNEVIKIIACAISKLLIAFVNLFNSEYERND